VKVGVIGVGSMGQNHARVLAELGSLAGIADPDPKAGGVVSNRFSVSYFLDHRALLREPLDAVVVCTPTHLHYEIAMDAIGAGKHLLVEKPLCDDLEDARKVVRAAREAGLVLAVGHIERHNPVVDSAKRHLDEGDWGDLITAGARRVSNFPDRIRDVGVMMDLAIHDVDILRYLVGKPVASVYAVGGRQRHASFEDHATILLDFQGGVNGYVEVNWLTPMKVRKLSLTCSRNFVELDYTAQTITISSSTLGPLDPFNLYQVPFDYDIRHVSLRKEEPLKRELQDFLQAIKEKREPKVNGEDAIETLRVVEAAAESQRTGKVIRLT
jgi:UDP-N-acetylglucosamine 3-dehydrogenase